MDFERVLASLQARFAGQMVLYAPDLAKILGKSEKAIEHLIRRSHLPFQVKSLGKARCVDIFQVAQWLSTDAAMAKEVADDQDGSKVSKAVRTTPQHARTDDQSPAAVQVDGPGARTAKKTPFVQADRILTHPADSILTQDG